MKQKGFTIVEILVILVVIGILATITMVSYQGVQAKARDTERKTEVQAIADAIKLHRLKFGNDVDTGSGCGGNNNGTGWFGYELGSGSPTSYTKSIMTCLKESGYLDGDMHDPSNCVTSSVAAPGKTCKPTGYTYMKYTCDYQGQRVSVVYARLETEDHTSDLDNFNGGVNTCNSIGVKAYNMNYMLLVD